MNLLEEVKKEIVGQKGQVEAAQEKPKRQRAKREMSKEDREKYRQKKMAEEEARYLKEAKPKRTKRTRKDKSVVHPSAAVQKLPTIDALDVEPSPQRLAAPKQRRRRREGAEAGEPAAEPQVMKPLQPLQPLYLLKIPGLEKACIAICLARE